MSKLSRSWALELVAGLPLEVSRSRKALFARSASAEFEDIGDYCFLRSSRGIEGRVEVSSVSHHGNTYKA